MNFLNNIISNETLEVSIKEIFAQVTRYPSEVLDVEAHLEEDLGIDSVKLGEVFSVIREKYPLPQEMDFSDGQLSTIKGIANTLHGYLSSKPMMDVPAIQENAGMEVSVLRNGNGSAVSSTVNITELEDEILRVFADVTRYPLEVLELQSDLEEDLGIDSVKLGEVFSVLREKYVLPREMDLTQGNLRTISGIAKALHAYIGNHEQPKAPQDQDAAAAEMEVNYLDRTPKVNGIHLNGAKNSAHAGASPSFVTLSAEHKPFTGKVAFVSGSGRGLGKDIATYLAELGAAVMVNSFHSRSQGDKTVEEIKEKGGKAMHLWGSMANPAQLHEMFDQIEEEFGALDFFISNASNGQLARLEDITVEHWEKAFRTNVIGLHQGALRAARLMKKRGGGKIITLSSPAAHGYVDYFGCMGAVKLAVESLTRSLAVELQPFNIQVNCVSPGPVYGELLNKWPESDRLIARWEDNTMYDRLCEARDVSHFIAYLLSDPVKLFNGSVLVMDGGISVQGW